MTLPQAIREQWEQPVQWEVTKQDDSVEISDEEGDFVVSSLTHDHVSETIDDHVRKVKTAATLELLLSMSDEHDA